MTSDSLADGLVAFYASQADLLPSQYENINQLLGPTKDWTHPGTHCEILIRDFLRRHLLQGMSVDKGFVYGRVERGGVESHGPEIDILIHNTVDFRPIFRLEDFVIVQPESVLGMIQVKRTFRGGKDGTLAKGIRQIVSAKQHLLDVTVQKRVRESAASYQGDDSRVRKFSIWQDMRQVFTAVVSFEDETDRSPETFRDVLLDAYRSNRICVHPDCEYDTSVYVLPDVVASLKHVALCSSARNIAHQSYNCFDSVCDEKNIGLQLFLSCMTNVLFDVGITRPPFAFPLTTSPIGEVRVPNSNESLHTKNASLYNSLPS